MSLKLYSDPETINKVCAGNIWVNLITNYNRFQ